MLKSLPTILIVGTGRIGQALGAMGLRNWNVMLYDNDYRKESQVFERLAENHRYMLKQFPHFFPKQKVPLLFRANHKSLSDLLKNPTDPSQKIDAIISAVPHHANRLISTLAVDHQVHYLDMTEDCINTQELKQRLQEQKIPSSVSFIPNNGIAPGFVSLLAKEAISQLQLQAPNCQLEQLTLRVGALPSFPTSNPLQYASTWSLEGCINQYVKDCMAVRNHQLVTLPPLTEYGRIRIHGTEYEEFSTSGGLGSLGETFGSSVSNITYKTLRYPGHWKHMRFLLEDLQFKHHPKELALLLNRVLPVTTQDIVIVHVTARGKQQDQPISSEYSLTRKITPQHIGKIKLTAIETATASSTIAMLELLFRNQVPRAQTGLCRVEDVSYSDFMKTHFANSYLQ